MASNGGTSAAGGGQIPNKSTTNPNAHPPGHSFLSAVNEVKNMENSLLSLLASFHNGDLSAFGKGHSLESMENIRAKQERLARMHFDLNSAKAQQQGDPSQDWLTDKDQGELVSVLRELSKEIEKLHDTSN